ncbi:MULTISPECIES: hypothetical protein [unclassified Pseudofrankia]|uniref:hypothetical protein n=1 Tax=unclassified Pseudofrankia TaxID=2994372 RepID=UPI0008DA8977|nr:MULTISPECIES: hypothetical protein [unclassified Pseudofrankia]MDT3445473.1 hypothetical protein [Pseudofrankia sp. BMG5.37]OHV67496.1 hypothetical protein BCD48_35220 [Pseudofrankia sp. BMG5.36]
MVADQEARIALLERQIVALTEAVRVIARGLESPPVEDEPFEATAERAARQAHEMLLSAGL